MKKRILAALVCAMMALSLAGCAAKEEERSYMSKNPDKDNSSYSEKSGSENSKGGSDSSSDNSSTEESDSDNSRPEESKPEESKPEDKPSNPDAEKIDWSKVPVVDEMDLDYKVYEADDIILNKYADWYKNEMKELTRDGCILITKYLG